MANSTSRTKYDPSLKTKVVAEYFRGASAKELYAKYGVKQRTVYEWSNKARRRALINDTDKQGIEFLNSIVDEDNQDLIVVSNDLENKVRGLEDKVSKLEYVIREFISSK